MDYNEEVKVRVFNFNEFQSPLWNTDEIDKRILRELDDKELSPGYLKEVRLDFLEAFDAIEFVQNMSSGERLRAKDLPRWDNPYKKARKEVEDGVIEPNLTNPHVLENMDYFRQPAPDD